MIQAQQGISRRLSSSSRRGSDATERRQVLLKKPDGPVNPVGDEDTDDEEEEELDPDTKAKHDAFVRARKGHYGYVPTWIKDLPLETHPHWDHLPL